MTDKKSIVILGAGFGGLKAAFDLNRALKQHKLTEQYSVTLVDRNSYHTYTPTLYEIATTSKETTNYIGLKQIVTFEIADLVKKTNIEFLKAEIKELDLIGGDIHFANGTNLKFHYLIIALGAEANYFDIPGLKENSIALKTFVDALKIRDKILDVMSSGKSRVKIVVGGGGSAGVELAGELQEWLCELKEEIRGCDSEVSIIEASPTVLPGFDPRIISHAQKRLKKLGVRVLNNETIDRVLPEKVVLKSRIEISYDVLVWTGGVKASSLISPLPLKIERRGRVEVAGGMECLPQTPDLKLYGRIYGLGDSICFYDPVSKKPMPGVARAAIDQAGVVAKNIICNILGKAEHKKYIPMNYPYVIPIGGKWALAKLGPVIIHGFGGWILKGLVELNYLLSIMPFWRAVRVWIRGLLIFIKNDRLG
ncbi:MAG: FAD-dependent oxidoreductase [bacterium]|nr:FAD-dependent oxidoreductase [bacterium]